MLSFFGDPIPDLDAAAAADPGWLLPPVMKAGFLLSLTEAAFRPQAEAALAGAEAASRGAPARERTLLAAVTQGWQGDWQAACDTWDRVLLDHPHDILALLWAHFFDFHRGDAWQLRRRVARVLPQWDASAPLYPYVLGMHAFGLEENHLHAEAEAAGRRALDIDPQVPWAVHAVAHVMEMQGRFDEGAAWLRRHRPHWSVGNGFAGHLWWHLGLFRLERLDTDGALRLYDEHLGGDAVQIAFQRLDATALLWRLHLLGIDGGERWPALAQGWDRSDDVAGWSAFNDLHLMLALAGAADVPAARRWLAQVERRVETTVSTERQLAARTGLALLQGLLAYAHGDDEATWRQLHPLRPVVQRLGGSHAQRDVIDQTLLAAAARGGLQSAGRGLVNERQLAKPATPLTRHWAGRLGVRLDGRPS
nr:tetratricopeptide repeat protein [Caldimonas mangrovi]